MEAQGAGSIVFISSIGGFHPIPVSYFLNYFYTIFIIKGQIKSERVYKLINFPNNDPKNLKDFCPMYCKSSQGRNTSNFLGRFFKIDGFIQVCIFC